LLNFDFGSLPDSCVLKPNCGFGGEGIKVLKGRKDGVFLERGKYPISNDELRQHIEDIIDGKFSINGRMDTAFFEQILIPHECFAPFRAAGLPDIRIIVFNLAPIMAMVRIPTVHSFGKANMHLGGVGIGVDIAKGITTHAAQYHHSIHVLPHGGDPSGIRIPFWDEILLVSSRIQHVTNIGYLAVDITIDEGMGPALLEVNARAGLMVQVANLAPLRSRLERIEGLTISSPEKGVRIAQELFGEKIKREDNSKDHRPILSIREIILVTGSGTNIEVPCLIAPDRDHTTFSSHLIRNLLKEDALELVDAKEKTYRVKFVLHDRKIQTLVHEGDLPSASVRAVIGRRDLSGFLIDPNKKPQHSLIHTAVKEDLRAVDKFLSKVDSRLLLLKFLKPINLHEERVRLRKEKRYNPIFLYPEFPKSVYEDEERLQEIALDGSPLGILLEKKRRELLMRITLLHNRGNAVRFSEGSKALFGFPDPALKGFAVSYLRSRVACDLPPLARELLTGDDVVPLFQEVLDRYGLHDWKVSVRSTLVADCTVGRKNIYIRCGARFSKEHIASLIAHEIETHVLTAENGDYQPFEIFRRGFANYLDTQEGLAVYNQNALLSPFHEKRYRSANGVLAIAFAVEHSFADTRLYLEDALGFDSKKALTTTIGLKRGLKHTEEPGAFMKGLVYFRGFRAIETFVENGGDLKRLYIGKIALEDLDLAEQVPGIKQALIVPEFLR
jgi:alpha-L-glutamate ligase-like protein/uncharacterized protein (TIGR02421 family)